MCLVSSETPFFIPSLTVHMLRSAGDPKEWVPEGDEISVCACADIELNGVKIDLK